jgi:hypothetical protein
VAGSRWLGLDRHQSNPQASEIKLFIIAAVSCGCSKNRIWPWPRMTSSLAAGIFVGDDFAQFQRDEMIVVGRVSRDASCLRHSIEMCRDVHGQHSEQKASENLQGRMTTRRAVEVIPDNEQQYASGKDADHVDVKP